jgi:hypothetical protein
VHPGHDCDWRLGFAAPGQDVDDDISGVDAFAQRLEASGFDRRQPVAQHRGEDVDHLPIAVGCHREPAADAFQACGQHPVLERGAVPERARLAGQNRHIVPRVEYRLIAPKAPAMFADRPAVLAQLDPVGIGADLNRPAGRAGGNRIPVVVKAHQAGLGDRCRHGMEPVEPTGIWHEVGTLGLEHLPDRLVPLLGMTMCACISNALVEQPGVQFVVGLHAQSRREEPFPHQSNLVLDLPLLPARRGRTGNRVNEIMTAHLQEAPIVGALAADEDRLHRGLHVVVYAARAGALEEGERPVVGVEHHLLRLARICPYKQHPAVAQPDMRHLHRNGRAVDQHHLVAPVELIGLAGRKAQRNEGADRCGRPIALPSPCIAAHSIVATFIAATAQVLENPDQRQPFASRLRLVRRQQLVKTFLPRPDPRQRLVPTLIAELSRLRTQNLPDNLPRHPKLTADRLDRLALDKIRPPNPRDRLHNQHPNKGPRSSREPS